VGAASSSTEAEDLRPDSRSAASRSRASAEEPRALWAISGNGSSLEALTLTTDPQLGACRRDDRGAVARIPVMDSAGSSNMSVGRPR
jgi:hypothetical protein